MLRAPPSKVEGVRRETEDEKKWGRAVHPTLKGAGGKQIPWARQAQQEFQDKCDRTWQQTVIDKEFACVWTTPARRLNFEFCFGDASQSSCMSVAGPWLSSCPDAEHPKQPDLSTTHALCAVRSGVLASSCTSTRPKCWAYTFSHTSGPRVIVGMG